MLRAVIYCRCSTEEESQVNALQNQVLEGEACVRGQGWLLADRYVELRSGTTTKGRDEYNRLYEDLRSDKFDVIVIKSQDRLMRNVRDWYLFLDRMLTCGKRLFIYLEGKFYTTDDALITGIKAILAEDYSRELSKKINNAHRNRQRKGGRVMLTSRVFGFRKCPDGSVEIVEEEAKIIREIFAYCITGYGCRSIANIYKNQGYVKKTGTAISGTFVNKVIRNPLYKGVMVMNRQHFDFETKRVIKVPEEEWIYGEGTVPPIVEKDVWESANAALTERAGKYRRGGARRKEVHREGSGYGKYELSGKLVCAKCGSVYYRVHRHGAKNRAEPIAEWKCSQYLEQGRREEGRRDRVRKVEKAFFGGCDNIHLDERVLFSLLEEVSEKYYHLERQDKERLMDHAISLLREVLGDKASGSERERIEEEEKRIRGQKERLLTKLLDGVISDPDYRNRNLQIEEKLRKISEKKDRLNRQEGEIQSREQGVKQQIEHRIEQIRFRLEKGGVKRAAANHMLSDIRQIRVHEWKLEICFGPFPVEDISHRQRDGWEHARNLAEGLTIWVDYPFPPETERGRYLVRRKIMELLREDPARSVKKTADFLGMSRYMIQNRFRELVKGGYIQFTGTGGHGRWEILRELSELEVARRNGEL